MRSLDDSKWKPKNNAIILYLFKMFNLVQKQLMNILSFCVIFGIKKKNGFR